MENIENNPRVIALIKKIQNLNATPKTKNDIVKEGAYKLVGGIVFWIAIFVLAASVGGFQKLFSYIQGGMALVGLVGIVLIIGVPFYGLWQIFAGLFSHQREESCPYCDQKITLLIKVRSSVCPNCGKLLHYSGNLDTSEMIKVECPVCKTEWGMAKDLEKVACQACGNSMVSQNDTIQSLQADGLCPACNKPVQKQAFFCPSCGELLTQPSLVRSPFRPDTETWSGGIFEEKELEGYLPDGMIREGYLSNSAKGYIIQAVWLENTIRKELGLALSKNTSISFYTLVYWMGRLDKMIAQLDFSLELDPDYTSIAQDIFAETDMLLGWSLRQAIDWKNGEFLQLLAGQSYFGSEKNIRNYLDTISRERNDFLTKLSAKAAHSNSFSSLEQWEEPVFEFNRENAGTSQRVFIEDWESAQTGKWFDRITKLNPGETLPSIRIPKIILAELSTETIQP